MLNKLAPVRAAVVSSAARRHPADGNSLIVRGLSKSLATWLALCLNHPSYEQLLVLESGVLRRASIGALEALRLPPVPLGLENLAAHLFELLDDELFAGESLHRLRIEATQTAAEAFTRTADLGTGTFVEASSLGTDSWVPSYVALRAEQAACAEESGWRRIADLATADIRTRIQSVPDDARTLCLGDVGDDLFIGDLAQQSRTRGPVANRLLAGPLLCGDVLVSTLGSSFRAVYVDDGITQNILPTDGWVRLRFRETPAAWALLLSTEPVRLQAARLAIGSARQFVPLSLLLSIHVPTPPREIRERWQAVVEKHHAKMRTLDNRWATLTKELSEAFASVHKIAENLPKSKGAWQ